MSTDLVTKAANQLTFSDEQVKLITNTIAKGATQDELKLFLYQAQRTGLDPLARQLYFIKRKSKNPDGTYSDKVTIQTSIDGFRVIAERSGDYAGQDEPEYHYRESDTNKRIPYKAVVRVYRFRGETRYLAGVGVAFWDEYAQRDYKSGEPTGMWKNMPHGQLAKCAEALALRKAYPQDLSGLYTSDEMQQSENTQPTTKTNRAAIDGVVVDEGDKDSNPYSDFVPTKAHQYLKKLFDNGLLVDELALVKPIEEHTEEEAKVIVRKYKESIK